MRILTIVSLVFLGCGAALIAQEQQGDRSRRERSSDQTNSDRSVNRPPWDRSSDRSDARSSRSSDSRQPPWGNGPPPSMQRGGFPQGQPSDRGSSSDRTSRMMGMFRSMDANRNGVLEPSEISETRRGFVSAIASRMGADPSRPINLADLERRAAASNSSSRSGNDSRSSRSESDRSRSATSAANEPLVPAFGEQQPAETPALAFGQRDVVVPIPVNTTAAAAMNPTAPAAPQAARSSTPYDNIAEDVRENTSLDWFFAYDKDADGQLTMQEYVGGYGGTWTPAIVSEFRFLDRNGDGFSTLDEVLLTLKEVDEQRAAEAAKETEQNRSVPGQPSSSPPSSPPQPVPPGNQPQPSAAGSTPPPNVVPVSANGTAANSGGYSSNRRGDDSRRSRRNYSRADR